MRKPTLHSSCMFRQCQASKLTVVISACLYLPLTKKVRHPVPVAQTSLRSQGQNCGVHRVACTVLFGGPLRLTRLRVQPTRCKTDFRRQSFSAPRLRPARCKTHFRRRSILLPHAEYITQDGMTGTGKTLLAYLCLGNRLWLDSSTQNINPAPN